MKSNYEVEVSWSELYYSLTMKLNFLENGPFRRCFETLDYKYT